MRSKAIACLMLGLVLLAGLDCKRRTDSRSSPLHQAARSGDVERIRSLVSRGADVNQKDGTGHTPLIAAILRYQSQARDRSQPRDQSQARNQVQAVEALLTAGADVNLKATGGEIPLLCRRGTRQPEFAEKIARLLLDKGADVNAKNQFGTTALH